MRISLHTLAIVAVAAASMGCGADVTLPTSSLLNGTWSRLNSIPGSAETWSLTATGASLSGTGTWSGEACCAGPLSLTGSVSGDSIHVVVTLSITQGNPRPDFQERFDGVLESRTILRGVVSIDGSPSDEPVIVRMQKR